MLNMLPKFELVPMMMYFMMLAKERRPSFTPSFNTARSFSSRMTLAASLATSTPFMTEMPTSAVCNDGASLMPSPMYPTTCPRALRARITRFFCSGDMRAKIAPFLGLVGQSGIVHRIDLVPRENAVRSQPNVMGDLLGHILVVAGHDKYGNTILFQRLKNGMNPLLWWVEECCKSDQRHVVLRCRGVDIL